MTDRVKMRLEATRKGKYPIVTEAVEIMIPSFERNDGKPHIVRRAQAVADYLDNRTIFIQDGELLVGNMASVPMGMEASPDGPTWPEDDLADLLAGNEITMSEEAKSKLHIASDYWSGKGRLDAERKGVYYDDDRLWPFIHRGFLCPPWPSRGVGRGNGMAGTGWGYVPGPTVLMTPDYETIISTGFENKIKEIEEAMKKVRYITAEDLYTTDYFTAALITLKTMIRTGERFSKLAAEMAEKETDGKRKAELLQISEICANVPRKPASSFREAMQAYYFFWCYNATGTMPGGRFDMIMYPYYKKDLEEGKITREEALELVELLRVKISEYNGVGGGKGQREKWAGMARWHNFILGGCDRDGNEATNEMTYIMLDATEEVRTPHPTLTVRVSDKTPEKLIKRSLELVRSGLGMPAFISEDLYMSFLTDRGVPLEDARDFAIAGCLDIQVPGQSRNYAFGMFIIPMVLELAMYEGCDPDSKVFFGLKTGKFEDFKSFDEFYEAFLKQLDLCSGMVNEEHNIQLTLHRDYMSDALNSVFFKDGVSSGKDAMHRTLPFENGSVLNMIGMANVANSLAAVKKLVFEEKVITAKELIDAMNANWEGYEEIRKMCLDAPKFGNDDDYVDDIMKKLWDDYAEIANHHMTIFGTPILPTATSITAHAPGGALTGPTPDGRMKGETLADGSVSPAQGSDVNGPLAVLNSGMKIPQDKYMATLLNMKFTPSTLRTDEDLEKLGAMVRAYLTNGGKHVQFNVVDKETLEKAKLDRNSYRDLIVRVAGYSSYFVVLTPRVQDEIIARTAQETL